MRTDCSCERCELRGLLYQHVNDEIMEQLCTTKVEHEYQKGEHIIEEGQPINEFVYLKKGLAKFFRRLNEGEEQIFSFAKPFDFVSVFERKFFYSLLC